DGSVQEGDVRNVKGPVAPAQQKTDGRDGRDNRGITGGRAQQVEQAVAVEIAHCQGETQSSHSSSDLFLERPVPAAQQDRNVARVLIGDGQVDAAVAVEVGGNKENGGLSHREAPLVLERPIPPAEENRNFAGGGLV